MLDKHTEKYTMAHFQTIQKHRAARTILEYNANKIKFFMGPQAITLSHISHITFL